jgi:hypothetical protein
MSAERIHPRESRTLARRLPVARHEFRRLVLGPAVPGSTRSMVPGRRQLGERGCEFQPPVTHAPQESEPGAILRREPRLVEVRVELSIVEVRAELRPVEVRQPLLCACRAPNGCKTATSGKPSCRNRCESISHRWSNLKQPFDPIEQDRRSQPNGIPQAIYPVVYAGDVRAIRTGSQPSMFFRTAGPRSTAANCPRVR